MPEFTKIKVECSSDYEVVIGAGAVGGIAVALKKLGFSEGRNIVIITDETVGALYADRVCGLLRAGGFSVSVYSFSPGEVSKSLATVSDILEFMAAGGVGRDGLVLALGGGVAGDIAGLAAAIYLRGTAFAVMPTTLLAAVDSSVGGKTGVNLAAGKNLAGAFHQPRLVLCDTDFLATLPEEVRLDGLAEAVKCGVICDRGLFDRLAPGGLCYAEIIADCVRIKSDIVRGDEYDRGRRQLLNLGHTVGHAIEACSGYRTSHGRAVAEGMAIITRGAEKLGWTTGECRHELLSKLHSLGLPVGCEFPAGVLYEAALSDKKRAGDKISLVIPRKIGECELRTVPVEALRELIGGGLGE